MKASTILPLALSIIAIGIAALSMSREPNAPGPRPSSAAIPTEGSPSDELTDSLREVNARLLQIEERLAQIEGKERLVSDSPKVGVPEADPLDQIEEKVAAALEEKGAEWLQKAQRKAKASGAREGMSKWVRSMEENLPILQRGVLAKMQLPPARRAEVDEILESGLETMVALTEELFSDPPPSEEEAYQVMGEIKETVGVMVEDLDVILDDDELIELGQIAVDSQLHGLGTALFEEGKDQDDEAGTNDGR